MAVATFIFLLPSCTRHVAYSPAVQNVPGFKEKNESRISAAIATPASRGESSFTIQGAYAVTNHFAVLASYNGTINGHSVLGYNERKYEPMDAEEYKRNSTEFGAGFFYPISADKKTILETYAGYGFGGNKIAELNNNTITGFHNSKTTRFFLQPIISFHLSRYATLSIPFRFTSVGYSDIKTNFTQGHLDTFQFSGLAKKRVAFLEPGCVLSVGLNNFPWIRIQCQANAIFFLGGPHVNYRDNYFSFGFHFDPVNAIKKGNIKNKPK